MIPFERHELVWTREKVARFWDWLSTSQPEDAYFARVHGAEIVEIARRAGVRAGEALDFGAGRGFLIPHLLTAGFATTAVDLSRESIERIEREHGGREGFRRAVHATGLPTDLPPSAFDAVFLLETIEHLDDVDLTETLTEIRRLLRPGGSLVLSTPNREDLRQRTVLCPDCGAVFHRVQHVRSIEPSWLAKVLGDNGLAVHSALETSLGGTRLTRLRLELHRFLRGKTPPNLIVVARKTG